MLSLWENCDRQRDILRSEIGVVDYTLVWDKGEDEEDNSMIQRHWPGGP